MSIAARLVAALLAGTARAVTGVRPNWAGCLPELRQRIYYANHTSHGDFVLLWTSPAAAAAHASRARWRPPITGSRGRLKPLHRQRCVQRTCIIAAREFEAAATTRCTLLVEARWMAGDSLILFPEGTRNMGDEKLLRLPLGHLPRQRARGPKSSWCRSGSRICRASCPRACCCRSRCSAASTSARR
jgi:1-acyl-sn-glycerol-3-phosphate acyltransferase